MKKFNLENLKDIEFEKHDLFHMTNSKINVLDDSFLSRDTDYHPNGALGFWCSTSSFSKIFSFGENCYKVVFKKGLNINSKGWDFEDFCQYCRGKFNSPIHDLRKSVNTREEYIELRNYLIDNGIDLIYILEKDFITEVILLNYNCVEKVVKVDKVLHKTFWIKEI